MKPYKILLIIIVNIFIFFSICTARETGPHYKYWYTYDGAAPGARAIGMGGAFVAVANSAEASYWNPAGLFLINNDIMQINYEALKVSEDKWDNVVLNDPLKGKQLNYISLCNNKTAVSWRAIANYRNVEPNQNIIELKINEYSISTASLNDSNLIMGLSFKYFNGMIGEVIKTGTPDANIF